MEGGRPMVSKGSNWETVAFLIIRKISKNSYFSRTQLMTPDNLSAAINILREVGHKERPDHPEETLQKTIQNLRDKGYIEFLGRGEYKLTERGSRKMIEVFESIKSLLADAKSE
jgi:hypothetical protein